MTPRPTIGTLDPFRQEKIRQANRIAARQCRQRKKEISRDMDSTLDVMMEENRLLTEHHETLKCWVAQLKEIHSVEKKTAFQTSGEDGTNHAGGGGAEEQAMGEVTLSASDNNGHGDNSAYTNHDATSEAVASSSCGQNQTAPIITGDVNSGTLSLSPHDSGAIHLNRNRNKRQKLNEETTNQTQSQIQNNDNSSNPASTKTVQQQQNQLQLQQAVASMPSTDAFLRTIRQQRMQLQLQEYALRNVGQETFMPENTSAALSGLLPSSTPGVEPSGFLVNPVPAPATAQIQVQPQDLSLSMNLGMNGGVLDQYNYMISQNPEMQAQTQTNHLFQHPTTTNMGNGFQMQGQGGIGTQNTQTQAQLQTQSQSQTNPLFQYPNRTSMGGMTYRQNSSF